MATPRSTRPLLFAAVIVALTVLAPVGAKATDAAAPAASSGAVADASVELDGEPWVWPLSPFRLTRPYVAPPHPYGPGHRGIDLAPGGSTDLRSPADGVIAFSGSVAGRGIVTIDHGGGLVTTLEPVVSEREPGSVVAQGEVVATIDVGGHSDAGTVHFGVRLNGEYINPSLLLGGVPRAVLLPCC